MSSWRAAVLGVSISGAAPADAPSDNDNPAAAPRTGAVFLRRLRFEVCLARDMVGPPILWAKECQSRGKFERSLVSHDEYESIRLTHHPTIYDVEPAELEAIRSRLRKMRAN